MINIIKTIDVAELQLLLQLLNFCITQVLANFLSAPLASGVDSNSLGWPMVAFDLDPSVVKVSGFICVGILRTVGRRQLYFFHKKYSRV